MTPCIFFLICTKYNFCKIRGYFVISAPIFKFKVSIKKSMDFQKKHGNITALIRPFHRHLKLENLLRKKEIAFYFEKMTFFVKFSETQNFFVDF